MASEMQVVGAGYGRTGTTSLKAALAQLGFGPCHHMTEVFEKGNILTWIDIERSRQEQGRADPQKLEEALKGYQSCVDWPTCRYWRELSDLYPNAKVLLSVRAFDGWYKSASGTIYKFGKAIRRKYTRFPWLRLLRREAFAWTRMNEALWGKTGDFEGCFEDKEAARRIYERHIEEVKAAISSERLLVFDVREGWEPLCKFLGVDVPDTPFPFKNTVTEADLWNAMDTLDYFYVGLPVVAVGAALWAILRAQRAQRA